jgi:hypothetical protein
VTPMTSIERSHDVEHLDDLDPTALVAPAVVKAVPLIAARLRERHPEVPVEVVDQHVEAAALRLVREARIHDFLVILIERSASTSLARRSG